MRIRSHHFALCLVLGCGTARTPAPVPAAPQVSRPAVAPPACTPNEFLAPASSDDAEWLRIVARELVDGASRKRLACLLGTDPEPDGDYVTVTEHGSGAERGFSMRPRVFVGVGDDAEKGVRLELVGKAPPALAAVEAALGKTHFGRVPDTREIKVLAPEGIDVSAVLTFYAGMLTAIELHRSDLRGPSPETRTIEGGLVVPKQVRAEEGGEVWVTPPKKRFAAGTWTFELSDASAGAPLATARCIVPEDIFERGTCTPSFDQYPGAKQSMSASAILVHVGGTPPELAIRVLHDGTLIAERRVKMRYTTVRTKLAPTGQATSGTGSLDLRR